MALCFVPFEKENNQHKSRGRNHQSEINVRTDIYLHTHTHTLSHGNNRFFFCICFHFIHQQYHHPCNTVTNICMYWFHLTSNRLHSAHNPEINYIHTHHVAAPKGSRNNLEMNFLLFSPHDFNGWLADYCIILEKSPLWLHKTNNTLGVRDACWLIFVQSLMTLWSNLLTQGEGQKQISTKKKGGGGKVAVL